MAGLPIIGMDELRPQRAMLPSGRTLTWKMGAYYEADGRTLCCNAPQPRGMFLCTKSQGHEDQHEAEDMVEMRWPNENEVI